MPAEPKIRSPFPVISPVVARWSWASGDSGAAKPSLGIFEDSAPRLS